MTMSAENTAMAMLALVSLAGPANCIVNRTLPKTTPPKATYAMKSSLRRERSVNPAMKSDWSHTDIVAI